MPPAPLPSRVRELREAAGWTRIQLAVYAGLAGSTLDKLEAAEACRDTEALGRVQGRTWRQLAQALDVPLKRLCPWLTDGS
jgi:transcriptional regulator with XRE-family HTH domain